MLRRLEDGWKMLKVGGWKMDGRVMFISIKLVLGGLEGVGRVEGR